MFVIRRGLRRRRRRRRRKKREVRRKAQTLPQVQLSQGCWMRGTSENMDGDVGFHSTRGGEGVRD